MSETKPYPRLFSTCLLFFCASCFTFYPTMVAAERIKELASLMGSRSNQLLGYGLVVGLPNTGDDMYSGVGIQTVTTMLRRLGVVLETQQLRLRNVAAVMVTADLPSFAAPGQRLDVTVSSLGNARSLEGGTLIATPLKGADLKVYAVAQGPLSVGGYMVIGQTGTRLQKNITTVGRVPGGAVIERQVPFELPQDRLAITLHVPDFTTSVRVAGAIHNHLKDLIAQHSSNHPETEIAAIEASKDANQPPAALAPPQGFATAKDSGTVEVHIPELYLGKIPELMAEVEALDVTPDWPAKVVINERTGTVVLGDSVRLTPVAIAHGGLTLEVRERFLTSQPNPFGQGTTAIVPESTVGALEQSRPLQDLNPGTTLSEVVKALNTLGVTPRDLVAILQALKASGALRAQLEIQ